MSKTTRSTTDEDRQAELPGGGAYGRSAVAFEALRELLRRFAIEPSQMQVSSNTIGGEASIYVGTLGVVDVLMLNAALRSAASRRQTVSVLEDGAPRATAGDVVVDTTRNEVAEVVGYLLRPFTGGESWVADEGGIRRPSRDQLLAAGMARLDRDRRATPQVPLRLVPDGERADQ